MKIRHERIQNQTKTTPTSHGVVFVSIEVKSIDCPNQVKLERVGCIESTKLS